MLSKIIKFSLTHKFIVLLFTVFILIAGLYSLSKLSIGAVPDVTNNQVQVITTSQNLSTQDMEQYITYPVELEMANLPGVKEIRSVSKFGLSVVTIIFDENMGAYLPRQLIAEKISSAEENIPEGYGKPQLGPITTGLGEIYQYTLGVEPGYEDEYTAEDLRTIQDWNVKRQLSGIKGVVEINAWGGYKKQYEVAIDTRKLQAMNLLVSDVYEALEKNNSISGGGYIEKLDQAYFIRGEGRIASIQDIGKIVVKTQGNIPVYIKDIAEVGFGNAPRFGAITANGKGETVLGQVMMLKGANSSQVIKDVKERVTQISENLPEGIKINPFLDRSVLIEKTTFTITENLILGCLIVIFVVVILLGNVRSGLVVASVIPLSLMFALTLMYIFGIDANLMSLGAIDFGIIIDGAVIIVEYTAFQIGRRNEDTVGLNKQDIRNLKDQASYSSASKMMNSAIFGQLIILIVFIPILSLSGVEGKMFRPMALTFSFALIGAMLLCLTYVPVASSLFLKAGQKSGFRLSERLLEWLSITYEKTIRKALKVKKLVIASAMLLLLIAVFIYNSMGGEFVPQLDEGDFVIQPVIKTGTSLSKTIEITTKMEKILLDSFPEVDQVVSRIGAAEVPTDPMSMEESDVIISLKPKSEWVSADTKDELAEKFKTALSIFPGMEIEFTQPIEMRFNELITGVRADIAIKIFGEDLEILNNKANEVKAKIENIPGASDVSVEKIVGLPQMQISFKRDKIARYGLNISDINNVIAMGFAGANAGSVFEGEKKFDLTMRLPANQQRDIENIRNLWIDTPANRKIPLSEVADISYEKGAAKISRDNTRRRIVIGVNVRNRDLESVVEDIQAQIGKNVNLPPGYSIEYGGQFENLQTASNRLKIAVPIALVLIFLLLYFVFGNVREVLIIYTAIPLAAVGGILLLWLRDMPFSISAGVGFIALFGIAVLNGIVLIEHFKELRQEGMEHGDDLIVHGGKNRLRAVLLTASAAALGFLPMAVSTNAGAEVQRPLATVVIGGLITSTLLTLIVLPIVYSIFYKEKKQGGSNRNYSKIPPLLILFSLISFTGYSQQKEISSFNELYELAVNNNALIKAGESELEARKNAVGSAFELDNTHIYYDYDENNLANGLPLKVLGLEQAIHFPSVYLKRRKVFILDAQMKETELELQKRYFKNELFKIYSAYSVAQARVTIYRSLDSLYENFSNAANRKFELGETNYLEKITAQAKRKQVSLELKEAKLHENNLMEMLKAKTQLTDSLIIRTGIPEKISKESPAQEQPVIEYYKDQAELSLERKKLLSQQLLLPDLTLNYFQGTNSAISGNLEGYQFGIRIPLFFFGKPARIKSAALEADRAEWLLQNARISILAEENKLSNTINKLREELNYYENDGNMLFSEILKMAESSYKNGEIDFFEYIQSLENAYMIRLGYLDSLEAYNKAIIDYNLIILSPGYEN